MSRLHAIQARRRELLRDIARARLSASRALGRARARWSPLSLGIAAWRMFSGHGWPRAAGLAAAAFALLRRRRSG